MFSNPQKNIEQFGVSEGMRVADLGTGSGHYALAAARKVGRDGRVYAIDIQEGLLSRLKDAARRERLDTVEVLRGDFEQPGSTNLRDNFVDAVLLPNVLFQVERKDVLLREAARILKPKGRLLIVDWKDSFGGLGPKPEHVVPERTAREYAERAGLTTVGTIAAGDHHYGLIFTKPL